MPETEVHDTSTPAPKDALSSNTSIASLDRLIYQLQEKNDLEGAQNSSEQLILQDGSTFKGYLRLGDTAYRKDEFKLAMLCLARAYEIAHREEDEKVMRYCLKKIEKCSHHTEWDLVFQEEELTQIPERLSSLLLKPFPTELHNAIGELTLSPTLCLDSRHRMYIPILNKVRPAVSPNEGYYKLPRFFRWIVPFTLAAMSTPRNADDITALAPMGIKTVLTLTEETPLPAKWFTNKPIQNIFMPVPNYYPPSIAQMDIIIQLLDNQDNLPMLVHCGGGKGRAGTVIACYLATYGFSRPLNDIDHPAMSAKEAIGALRAIRPGSLETKQQEDFVSKWCSNIWKRQSVFPSRPTEPPACPMEVEGSIGGDTNLFVLVGLPGSGKSWFSNSLIARNSSRWRSISQDDSGSRAFCETEISRTPSGKTRVLSDRCNTSSEDRKSWLNLAGNWAKDPICIWFDYPKELCTARAQSRVGHPTLPPGSRVRNAVQQMDKMFEKPDLKEGFKGIVTIRSFEAALELVKLLSPPVEIYKYPRTPHLVNLGAATSDDLVERVPTFSSESDLAREGTGERVVITEKIDGANMGISLSSDSKIIVQNRSHYVNTQSHEQFKKLGHWIDTHKEELQKLLVRDPYFPERYILFGEWMYATHSIHYTALPDRFIAFDMYDRSTDTFLDRQTLDSLLQRYARSISLVPLMAQYEVCPTERELRDMVQRPSQYYDGRVEGIYVKWEKDGRVVRRGKVVRGDFIAGNQHWAKRKLEVNGLAKPEG
ncbi:uncharacterized protein I303_106454 [Kwoniella dejecticola CBS 10117]|uniref:Tyrosine specific protein phosphatases domain-containing protein n=1 Tax=Kwoniella dejecticola CBS 10117 TaxID=1296121 RepID=A0A1A5ZUN4_9TREE|nr:uncharacterized protein I303_08288 [Kwoniella dejecticola CBS 10117]OBR81518.1 hypothetical protein I303_08288 [Kwoniella dejecticola CBS 10117]